MDDLISRQEAIEYFMTYTNWHDEEGDSIDDWDEKRKLLEDYFNGVPSAQQWHVIKKRPMTNDERIEWSEMVGYDVEDEDAFIYWNLPDDGEEVFVSSQYGYVYVDTFCRDEGCYFEESGDMDGIVAWMPLPKPYKGEES